MTNEAYIEQLRLCPLRPKGPLPRVSSRYLDLVRDHGVLEPVIVRRVEEHYEILGSVESWMAAQQIQLESVPIHVLDDVSDEEAAAIVAAAFSGYDSDPIDEAEYFQTLVAANPDGRSKHQAVMKLAYQTGHSRPYISHRLRLLRLPQEIQGLVREGRLSAGHGRALAGIESRREQLVLAKRALMEKLSVRDVEAFAREAKNGKSATKLASTQAAQQPVKAPSPDVVRLQTRIAETVGCEVELDTEGARMTIVYHNLDILDGVLAKLGIGEN